MVEAVLDEPSSGDARERFIDTAPRERQFIGLPNHDIQAGAGSRFVPARH